MNSLDIVESVLDQVDVFIFCKDKSGRYIFANEKFSEAAGLDSSAQIVGKTDENLVWQAQSDYFQSGDKSVMAGNVMTNASEFQVRSDGVAHITTSKNVLVSSSGVIDGIIGSFIDHSGSLLLKTAGTFDPIKRRVLLGDMFDSAYLSYKEALVYFHILLGRHNAEISAIVKISVSTVNFHTENLKMKLQCKTRGDLIAVGISTGLTYTVFTAFNR